MSKLVTAAGVKTQYRRSLLVFHPGFSTFVFCLHFILSLDVSDKVKGATGEVKYIADTIFNVLKEQWKHFSTTEL